MYEIYKCPKCGGNMKKKLGTYGEFWGCDNFPKCKGTLNIDIPKLELYQIDYFEILNTDEIQNLAKEVFMEHDKYKYYYSPNDDIKKCLKIDVFCYNLLDYLLNKKRFLDISKVAYAIHKVRKTLPYNFNYWVDIASYSKNYKEKDIKKVIIDTWQKSLFFKLNMKYISEEYIIGNEERHGIIDILANDNKMNGKIFIEIKSPKVKGRMAAGQLNDYLTIYKNFNNDVPKAYIVGRGYPFGIYDYSLGYISFAIEENKISFIPWRIL